MFGNVSLFPHKELASAFLSTDHGSQECSTLSPSNEGSPTAVLAFLESKAEELQQWRQSVRTHYLDAFHRSGHVVDLQVELKNFAELKSVNKAEAGLHAFLEMLLKETPHGCNDSAEKITDKLRGLKKECKKVMDDNAALAASFSAQFEGLSSALKKAETEVHELTQMPELDSVLSQSAARREELKTMLEREEQENVHLLAEIAESDIEGHRFEEALQEELSEITFLNDAIKAQTEDALTKQERHEAERQKTKDLLKEMEYVCALLKKVGGTEAENITGNPLIVKLRTDAGYEENNSGMKTMSVVHRLSLEMDPMTFLIRSARLHPDEGIPLNGGVLVGQPLSAALAHVRSLLYIAVSRRLRLEALSEYRFTRADVAKDVWRVVLPNQTEIEMMIPPNWPFECDSEFQLLEIQAPVASINFTTLTAQIKEMHFTDLRAFLHAVTEHIHHYYQTQIPGV